MNKKFDLDAMSVDEMWRLHEKIGQVLSVRLTSEKRELEKRLAKLRRENEMHSAPTESIGDCRAKGENIRAFIQSIKIPMSLRKPGQVAANNRAGWQPP